MRGKGQEGRGLIARGWSVWRDRPWELGYLNSYKYIQWLKDEIEIAQVIQATINNIYTYHIIWKNKF